MHEQAATRVANSTFLDTDAEHVMPPELPTQDSSVEDSVGQLSRVQNKLVDTLHALSFCRRTGQRPQPGGARDSGSALTLVGDTDDSETIGPIDWVKFGEACKNGGPQGTTQEWLADRVGVTATTIRQLEHHTAGRRRSLMLKLLAVPELNLRVSDIELSAEMSAGYRHTPPTSWLGSTYDPVSMVTELAETLNGPTGQKQADSLSIDHHSAKDWLATCSSPDYGSGFARHCRSGTVARRVADPHW